MPEQATPTENAPSTEAAPGSSTENNVTLSQEKLDRIIASRVAETQAKFADYDDLKAAAERLADVEKASLSESERIQRERDEAKAQAEDTASRLTERERENARLRVALETKLPAELIDRLQGDTEDALREDAAKLLELVKPSGGSFDGGARKSTPSSPSRDEIRELARSNPSKFNAMVESGQIPANALA